VVAVVVIVAAALAERGQLDEAWRCIDEALTLIEKTKERLHEAEVTRIAEEMALKAPQASSTKGGGHISSARSELRERNRQNPGNCAPR
jgi:hypothetical protein